MKAIEKIFGTHSERELKRIYPLIDKIESYRPAMQELTDEQLKDKTKECAWNGTLPCSADWWYYPASGTYR